MKLDALIPLVASVTGGYLILRSGYLRAVLLAPFRQAPGPSATQLAIEIEPGFDFIELRTSPEPERQPNRAHN